MVLSEESLCSRFQAFREKFFSSGGKPKGLKYPLELRQLAVEFMDLNSHSSLAEVSRKLGISQCVLKQWGQKLEVKSIPAPSSAAGGTFIPVEVKADTLPDPISCGDQMRMSVREISVELPPGSGESLVLRILSRLMDGGRAPC